MIVKGTIVKNFLEENPAYSIMFIGQVVEVDDGKISLSPCVMGYKLKHQDSYTMRLISDSVREDIGQDGLEPVGVDEYDAYLRMLGKTPITITAFRDNLIKELVSNTQEEQLAEEESD